MAKSPQIIADAAGLQTQPNELTLPAGSLSVGENVEITRDGIVEVARGFKDFSANLPDFTPEQLLVVGGVAYLNLDNGLWYYDSNSNGWLRKSGSLGTAPWLPQFAAIVGNHLYMTVGPAVVLDFNLSTGSRTILSGRYSVQAATDGTGDAARFGLPEGICTDGTNLYVADEFNYNIRKIVIATGATTTIAGSADGSTSGTTDGTGTAARFTAPDSICTDGTNLYVGDIGVGIRKIVIATAVVSTIKTTGFTNCTGMCTDGTNLYANGASGITKIVLADLSTSVIASGGGGMCLDSQDANLYVTQNNTVQVVNLATTNVTTLCGSAGISGDADGMGSAARFNSPNGICTDGLDFYVCDTGNNKLRKVYQNGLVATLDGSSSNAFASPGIPLISGFVARPPS
jgi:hypothetical protein